METKIEILIRAIELQIPVTAILNSETQHTETIWTPSELEELKIKLFELLKKL